MYIHNFCYNIIGVNIENTTIMSIFICCFYHYFYNFICTVKDCLTTRVLLFLCFLAWSNYIENAPLICSEGIQEHCIGGLPTLPRPTAQSHLHVWFRPTHVFLSQLPHALPQELV